MRGAGPGEMEKIGGSLDSLNSRHRGSRPQAHGSGHPAPQVASVAASTDRHMPGGGPSGAAAGAARGGAGGGAGPKGSGDVGTSGSASDTASTTVSANPRH